MITLTYTHTHPCAHGGDSVVVRPEVEDGVYFAKVPICLELGTELELVSTEVSS